MMTPLDSTRALIMAGGSSERMRASGESTHKALTRVHGVTLLEWNLRSLVHFGFHDIVVAVSSSQSQLASAVASLAADRDVCRNATVAIYTEARPLGNVGAAREVIGGSEALLMLYVDNLATIDLRALWLFHTERGFALTLATHRHDFKMPFGRLSITEDEITRYEEKPTFELQVSSGTCVLSKRACNAIPKDQMIGASDLFASLKEKNETVGAFQHDGAWIDINDVSALDCADRLIAQHWNDFERLMVP